MSTVEMRGREERDLLRRLQIDGRRLARRFRLRLRAIGPEGPRVTTRYGSCREDGTIRIRLRRRNGQPMSYRWLLLTLCHELAHLRFMDHGYAWALLYKMIVAEVRTGRSGRQYTGGEVYPVAAGLAARNTKRRRRKRRAK